MSLPTIMVIGVYKLATLGLLQVNKEILYSSLYKTFDLFFSKYEKISNLVGDRTLKNDNLSEMWFFIFHITFEIAKLQLNIEVFINLH